MNSAGQDDSVELRLTAGSDGVVPVPFLGKTWLTGGAAYWWRRAGAVLLFLVLLAFTGAMATGFSIGIYGDGGPARTAFTVLYSLTGLIGLWYGTRLAGRAPLGADGGRGMVFPSGIVALVLAPIAAGLVLALLVRMFGRDFLGERRAREATAVTRPLAEDLAASRRQFEERKAREQAVREARRSERGSRTRKHPRSR